MEKAIYLRRIEDLQGLKESYDRAYYGHEFCERLMPSADESVRAMQVAREKGMDFTCVTPFVTNAGLAHVRKTVAALAEESGNAFEVVVNDWGVLNWMKREHPEVPLALGRLLTKQKRGPRLLRISEKLPTEAMDHFRRSNVDVPHVRDFLKKMGVKRVELDNVLQGMVRDNGLPASLHYPYGYISTTRLCLMMDGDKSGKNLRSLGNCARECERYDVTLTHGDMPVPLLLKGNTYFFHNPQLPDDLDSLNVTRLVRTAPA